MFQLLALIVLVFYYKVKIDKYCTDEGIKMGKQKKVWSELQDQLLKKFYEEQQMRNWSLIAKKMTQQFYTPKKSGKQCRERYENHIDSSVIKIQWTKQEEKQLIRLHNEIGNKWANIALNLPGKSDNCVKNHFYSKLRKVLRKLNRIIHHHCRREFRQVNINMIYKLVEATQQRLKDNPNCSEEVSLKCRDVQNRMLDVAIGWNEEYDIEEGVEGEQNLEIYKDIIRDIYSASRQYKRKSKKSRNLSIQAPNVKKTKEKKSKTIVVRSNSKAPSDGYMSDSEHGSLEEDQEDSNSKRSEQNYHNNKMPHNSFIVNEEIHRSAIPEKKIQIEEGKEGIENMLRENNILENDFTTNHLAGNNMFRFSDKSSFKSYNSDRESDRDFFNMFEASDAEHGSRRKNSKFLYFAQKPDDNKSICFSQKQ